MYLYFFEDYLIVFVFLWYDVWYDVCYDVQNKSLYKKLLYLQKIRRCRCNHIWKVDKDNGWDINFDGFEAF